LLRAEALRATGKIREAVDAYEARLREDDSWFGHYGLAHAYLDLRAYREAYAELATCFARRGEAVAFWLPSLHLVPILRYELAVALEGLGSPDAPDAFKAFLAMEPEAQKDPLVGEARKRVPR
jgi:tetratricopeptide (TPR) repeat protein